MSIITCPDCSQNVSDQAPACPGCGYPVASVLDPIGSGRDSGRGVQTVEATGKGWKGVQLVGGFIFLAMMALTCAANADSANPVFFVLGAIGGLVLFVLGRVGAWWHHG